MTTKNPCAELPKPNKLITVGIHGTRLQILGTRSEVNMVVKAVKLYLESGDG